jgi:hypothetical protein
MHIELKRPFWPMVGNETADAYVICPDSSDYLSETFLPITGKNGPLQSFA